MAYFVSPVRAHDPEDFHPPGIIVDSWCYLVSDVSLSDLQDFVNGTVETVGASVDNIRTPANGSLVSYIALTSDQRDLALVAGAFPAPTEGKARAKAFDSAVASGPGWEP